MNTVWFSLRRRLLALLLGGLSLAWLATVSLSYIDAHHEVDQMFDAQMTQLAQTLLALASHEADAGLPDIGDLSHPYHRKLHFQIWRADGNLQMRSPHAPELPLTVHDGFAEIEGESGHWRLYSRWNPARTLQVQIGEDHQIRDELIGHIAWRLVLPALFGLPLIGLWVWFGTRSGMASLDGIAGQIARRAPQQLQPLCPPSAPEEIRPLLEALNGLFRRVDEAITAERHFTANAAHELRTPLAALQAQLQVVQRARDEAERAHALAQLQQGLTRAAHLVDQMLQLARLDPESGIPEPQRVALGSLAESVCAELGALILDRELDFDLNVSGECTVMGQAEWLHVLLRNLLDNAIRYTPKGGRITVTVNRENGAKQISVRDNGPGIPEPERDAVLQRFHRLLHSDIQGTGLGLAIVARIAELHGARLHLSDNSEDGHGLCVTVIWPDAPEPAA